MAVIKEVQVEEGYEPLFDILVEALNQAQKGKGSERHAQNQPFLDQPIVRLGLMYGPGGPGQQVGKKTQEAMRLPLDRAVAEVLGAINYAAAMAIVMRKLNFNSKQQATLPRLSPEEVGEIRDMALRSPHVVEVKHIPRIKYERTPDKCSHTSKTHLGNITYCPDCGYHSGFIQPTEDKVYDT